MAHGTLTRGGHRLKQEHLLHFPQLLGLLPRSLPLPHVHLISPHPGHEIVKLESYILLSTPVLVVGGEAINHDGYGQGEDEDPGEGAAAPDDLAQQSLRI